MSYLTVTSRCSCADCKIPLRAIKEIIIPRGKDALSFLSGKHKGEYVITVNYLEDDAYQLKFCQNCWNEVEKVIDELKQILNPNLFKESA